MLPPDIEKFLLLAATAQADLAGATSDPQRIQNCEILRWHLKDFASRLEEDKTRLCTKSCQKQEEIIQALCAHALLSEIYARRIDVGDPPPDMKTLKLSAMRQQLAAVYEELSE